MTVNDQEYTIDYFDNLLEAMVKSTKERCYRQSRLMPGETLRPTDSSPEKSMIHGLQRDVDNSPMKTARGKASVKRQARKNKMHPEKFAEAIDFIQNNIGDFGVIDRLDVINDKPRLKLLAQRLIPGTKDIQREWLENICTIL